MMGFLIFFLKHRNLPLYKVENWGAQASSIQMESKITMKKKRLKEIKRKLRSVHIRNIIFQVHCPGEKTMPLLKLGKRSSIKEKAEEAHGQNPGEKSIYNCISYSVYLTLFLKVAAWAKIYAHLSKQKNKKIFKSLPQIVNDYNVCSEQSCLLFSNKASWGLSIGQELN